MNPRISELLLKTKHYKTKLFPRDLSLGKQFFAFDSRLTKGINTFFSISCHVHSSFQE